MSGDGDDPFDLNKLALTQEEIAELAPLQKKAKARPARRVRSARLHGRFVQLPYERTLAAAGLVKSAPLAVLVELAYRMFKTRQNPVKLSNKTLRVVGISHDAKTRALRQLEAAGLVAVSWEGRGKSPLVMILWE
jgi:DNA-binding transcriptional ArsR family regulator